MLNLEQVLEIVPVSRSTLLRMESEGLFPAGVFISPNRKVWYEDHVTDWQRVLNGKPSLKRTVRRRRK
jgi:predicted DNA-binding transcriptional regulator AlpA